jgi:DNA-binding NtrC family response regulator
MSIRVLLVDDEKEFLEVLAERLEGRGLMVRTALSGPDALEELKREEIDMVVLDVAMPGMSGIEILSHIRQINSSIQVIMLTGQATVESGMEALELGAFNYILKPVEIDALVAQIQRAYAHYHV